MALKLKILYTPADLKDQSIILPMFHIAAGKPDSIEQPSDEYLNLLAYLIKHPDDTYILTAVGDSMIDAKIDQGDLLIVDRVIEAADKKIVIVDVEGELCVKYVSRVGNRLWLVPANPNYQKQEVRKGQECKAWGIVTFIIKRA
jgi:DNA polymerase V